MRPSSRSQADKREVNPAHCKQTPTRFSDIHLKTVGKPRNTGGDKNGDDGQQPDVAQQKNSLFLPAWARYQLRPVGVRTHRITVGTEGCAATVALLLPAELLSKLLLSRNGCECTFFPSGAWKSSTCNANAWAPTTWLRRKIGESPITSIPLNFGSMIVLPTAVLAPCASPSTKARP